MVTVLDVEEEIDWCGRTLLTFHVHFSREAPENDIREKFLEHFREVLREDHDVFRFILYHRCYWDIGKSHLLIYLLRDSVDDGCSIEGNISCWYKFSRTDVLLHLRSLICSFRRLYMLLNANFSIIIIIIFVFISPIKRTFLRLGILALFLWIILLSIAHRVACGRFV